MELTQLDKLDILALTGNHQDDTGMEPLTEESGPRFPYGAIRERIKERSVQTTTQASRVQFVEYDECSESDMYGTHCERVAIESADYLPSSRNRSFIHDELRSMGCTWGE